eukprot:1140071-Pelagomonas_calceolata.AAC.2
MPWDWECCPYCAYHMLITSAVGDVHHAVSLEIGRVELTVHTMLIRHAVSDVHQSVSLGVRRVELTVHTICSSGMLHAVSDVHQSVSLGIGHVALTAHAMLTAHAACGDGAATVAAQLPAGFLQNLKWK